jgi:hypothetical protein
MDLGRVGWLRAADDWGEDGMEKIRDAGERLRNGGMEKIRDAGRD